MKPSAYPAEWEIVHYSPELGIPQENVSDPDGIWIQLSPARKTSVKKYGTVCEKI
jgi:hypothetical protein